MKKIIALLLSLLITSNPVYFELMSKESYKKIISDFSDEFTLVTLSSSEKTIQKPKKLKNEKEKKYNEKIQEKNQKEKKKIDKIEKKEENQQKEEKKKIDKNNKKEENKQKEEIKKKENKCGYLYNQKWKRKIEEKYEKKYLKRFCLELLNKSINKKNKKSSLSDLTSNSEEDCNDEIYEWKWNVKKILKKYNIRKWKEICYKSKENFDDDKDEDFESEESVYEDSYFSEDSQDSNH